MKTVKPNGRLNDLDKNLPEALSPRKEATNREVNYFKLKK